MLDVMHESKSGSSIQYGWSRSAASSADGGEMAEPGRAASPRARARGEAASSGLSWRLKDDQPADMHRTGIGFDVEEARVHPRELLHVPLLLIGRLQIAIEPAQRARRLERAPVVLRLREPVGHRVHRQRIVAQAGVAADDFDVFGVCRGISMQRCQATMRPCGYRSRWLARMGSAQSVRSLPRRSCCRSGIVDPPDVGRPVRPSERTAERDHAAHFSRRELGEFARVDAAELQPTRLIFS